MTDALKQAAQQMLSAIPKIRFDSLNMTLKDLAEIRDAALVLRAALAAPAPAAPQAVNPLDALLTRIINRRVTVEQQLFDMAAGKLPMPDKDKLRELAVYLGDPAGQPTTPAPAQAVPLTDFQIDAVTEAAHKTLRRACSGAQGQQMTMWHGIEAHVVRATERAHGIKQPGSEAC